METPSLDKDFWGYWMRLSVLEKQSLLQVAKHYVELKDDSDAISIDQYNTEIHKAMQQIDSGYYYSREQVVQMSKGWLNDK